MPFQTPPDRPAQVQEKSDNKKADQNKKPSVKQGSSGANSPNVVTGNNSPVTIYPPRDVSAGTLEPGGAGGLRQLEIGNSGIVFSIGGLEGKPFLRFWNDSNLLIEEVNEVVVVSTDIRDAAGKLIAEVIRNEWKTRPSLLWDRNFDKNKLEVRDEAGYVVLQVVSLPDRIQIQGVWRDSKGHSLGLMASPDPNQRGGQMILNRPIAEMKIKPIFMYPSELHLGELAK